MPKQRTQGQILHPPIAACGVSVLQYGRSSSMLTPSPSISGSLPLFLLYTKEAPLMGQMTAVQISSPGAPFEVVIREIPAPGSNTVRIRVQACGICHSDVFVKEGHWPGLQYPRVTGHEVAGVIDEVGAGVTAWKKGQRVGVGWHGGHCGQCVSCRRGDFISCQNLRITGFR